MSRTRTATRRLPFSCASEGFIFLFPNFLSSLTLTEEQRKLAAIVFTDMVGYTALSQRDEARALHLLEKHNALTRSVLSKYRGREVKTIGDAFLLEFDSALDATLCAIEIQQELHEHNQSATEPDRVNMRIGIHEGDVVHRGLTFSATQ